MRTSVLSSIALSLLLMQTGCASIMTMTSKQSVAPTKDATAKFSAAKEYEAQGRFEQAREFYQSLHDKQPKNLEYIHRLAVVSTRSQRFGEAESLYLQARKMDPKNASLVIDAGYSAYLKGDFPKAEKLFHDALHLKPDSVRATNNLALVLGRRGKIEESLKLLKQVNSEAEALSSLGFIHQLRGESNLAERCYRDALAIDPLHQPSTQALAELSKPTSTEEFMPTAVKKLSEVVAELTPAASEFDRTEIQQVASVVEKHASQVTNASFTSDALVEDEPDVIESASGIVLISDEFSDADESESGDDKRTASPSVLAPQFPDWAQDDPAEVHAIDSKNRPSAITEASADEPATDKSWDGNEAATLPLSAPPQQLTFGPQSPVPVRRVPKRKLESEIDFLMPLTAPSRGN